MARFQIVVDARDAVALSEFWQTALRYGPEPPPPGFASWAEFAERHDVPREQWRGSAIDPDGVLPRLLFQPVPEPKVVKNRLHLDLSVSDRSAPPEARRAAVAAEVQRLIEAGASVARTVDSWEGHWVVMQDPEGNEFCVQ